MEINQSISHRDCNLYIQPTIDIWFLDTTVIESALLQRIKHFSNNIQHDTQVTGLNKSVQKKEISLLATTLSIYIINQYYEVCFNHQTIKKTSWGKPYIPDSDIQFNWSHTKQYIVLAVSPNAMPVGADVESIHRRVRHQQVAEHAFTMAELQKLSTYKENSAAYVKQWFTIWTQKEALLKAIGVGITTNLNTVNTLAASNFTGNTGWQTPLAQGNWFTQTFYSNDAVVSVAWPNVIASDLSINIQVIDELTLQTILGLELT